ncbi:MAG: phytanoyl-CoA dioxygenase family protein [Chromatiales bacterium]|jgi:hypothetical protein
MDQKTLDSYLQGNDWAGAYLKRLQEQFYKTGHGELFNRISGSILQQDLSFTPVYTDEQRQQAQQCHSDLSQNGFATLGSMLTADACDKLVNDLSDYQLEARCSDERHDLTTARQHWNIAHYARRDLLQLPQLMALANHPQVIAAVERYLGVTPTLANPVLFWSFAQRDAEAKCSQSFHTEYHSCKFLKLIVYLTEVDMQSGPFVFVKGSRYADLAAVLLQAKDRDRVLHDWFAENPKTTDNYKSDATVEAIFGKDNILALCGKAGDAFLASTESLHKGLQPMQHDRLVFMCTYLPMDNFREAPAESGVTDYYERLGDSYGAYYKPEQLLYMNRLLVKATR